MPATRLSNGTVQVPYAEYRELMIAAGSLPPGEAPGWALPPAPGRSDARAVYCWPAQMRVSAEAVEQRPTPLVPRQPQGDRNGRSDARAIYCW